MSIPILYDTKETNFHRMGIGPLVDLKEAKVDRERHGIYSLSFKYPVKGILFRELKPGRWIKAHAGYKSFSRNQLFEILTVKKIMSDYVEVYCEHFSGQLMRSVPDTRERLSNITAERAIGITLNATYPGGIFSYSSNLRNTGVLDLSDPSRFANTREVLGGVEGSILDNFGGEYRFNNEKIELLDHAGENTNIVIAYGKNIIDFQQEENISSTYSGIYPWAKLEETNRVIKLTEGVVKSEYSGQYRFERYQKVDFSDKAPQTSQQLKNLAQSYIKANSVGVPKVSIQASYEDIASSVLPENLQELERIDLCDVVNVSFEALGVNTKAKIIKTTWNVLADKYESIELGSRPETLSTIIGGRK